MLKLLPILFFAAVNITQISIFEIDGIFSKGHINAIERYVNENEIKNTSLFVIQYNASDVNENSINELQELLKNIKTPKAIWVGPNKTTVDARLLKSFDYVGISPGTTITNKSSNFEFEFTNSKKILLIDREADIFQAKRVGADGYLLKPIDKTNLKNLFT